MESDAISSWCHKNCLWEVWGNHPHNHPHNILKLVAEHRRPAYIIPLLSYDLHIWTCDLRYHGYYLLSHILSIFSLKNLHICSCCAVHSHSVVSHSLRPHELQPTRLLCPWDSPGKSTGVGSHALLQGIFPTQGSNPGLPHCRWIIYVWTTREAQESWSG